MATFTEKAKFIERVRKALKKTYGDQPEPIITHPVEHALRIILSEEATPGQVDAAMERFRSHFVDWNDLRVSRPREIREVLGKSFPRAGHKARVIPRLLDQVFKQHNNMRWEFLEDMGKTDTRSYFESLEEVRPFLAASLARDFADAHAFPADADVVRVMDRLGVVDPEEEAEEDIQKFLERAVKSPKAYETHQLVKRLAARICVPGEPKCDQCPLNTMCPTGKERLSGGKSSSKKSTKKKSAPKKKSASKKSKSKKKSTKKKSSGKKSSKKSSSGKTSKKK